MHAIRRRSLLGYLVMFLAGPLSARAATTPALIVLPQRGPVGTTFTIMGTGLSGQTAVTLVEYTLVPNPAGGAKGACSQRSVFDGAVSVDGAGTFTMTLDSTTYIPGEYFAVLPQVPGRPQLTFTVIGIPTGLPATGGGWARRPTSRERP